MLLNSWMSRSMHWKLDILHVQAIGAISNILPLHCPFSSLMECGLGWITQCLVIITGWGTEGAGTVGAINAETSRAGCCAFVSPLCSSGLPAACWHHAGNTCRRPDVQYTLMTLTNNCVVMSLVYLRAVLYLFGTIRNSLAYFISPFPLNWFVSSSLWFLAHSGIRMLACCSPRVSETLWK